MNRRPTAALKGILLAACLAFLGTEAVVAQPKFIKLRNETISTAPPAAAPASGEAAAAEAWLSGLVLIQFTDAPKPEWREALRALGVDLLHYVPDDAFVARATRVSLPALRRLPFVHWVGRFRPEHKIHAALVQPPAAGDTVAVSVLLAPDAAPAEAAVLRQTFRAAQPDARYRFGTILRGHLAPAQVRALAESEQVLWIEPAPRMKLFDAVASRIVAGANPGTTNTTAMMDLGYDGTGVTVAVADSGLDSGDLELLHPDIDGRVVTNFFYGSLTDAADEHSHGTHVAGIVAGNGATGEVDENGFLYGLGVAPGARLIGQRIFGPDGEYEAPPTFETLTRHAVQAGADIGSNSWGDDAQGRYDTSAMEFDALVRDADALTPGDQPYILEFSAGNAGPGTQTIGSPALAKNVIATGAAQNDRPDLLIYGDGPDAMADFSSRGPCEDGRIKPDVTAPGTWIASLRSVYANDSYAWATISDYYLYQGGTSQAGPHVSGAAAVFVQFYRAAHAGATPSPALVKAALINSAVDMWDDWGTEPTPNMDEGWGRVDLTQLIGSPRNHEFLDQTVLLQTGQHYERRVLVDRADEPLFITLAYTDVPGFAGAIPALVNDLDLEVVAPDGRVYRGNQFEQGESVPDVVAADNLNNVEGVRIFEPVPGAYTVRVRARNVAQDARADTPGVIDQDFALVVSAAIAPPGTGIVTLDRGAYRVPDVIRITLVDDHLAGQPTVPVLLRSDTEPTGESITLAAAVATGLLTNSVATATGGAGADGRLQVSHGDTIEVIYQDANPATTRTFTARADLQAPIISGVLVTNRFGRPQVQWSTDEPARSLVRFGTNAAALDRAQTNLFLEVDHAVTLENLVPGRTNYFLIVCTDEAGNATTNDNGGQLYRVVAPRAPAVLVVDAFFGDAIFDPPPPIENYTRALDRLGVQYDLWSVEAEGVYPTAADLQPYRVVIWRVPELMFFGTALAAAERNALTTYLTNGGSLLMASMELCSRLDESGGTSFRENFLRVASYTADATVPDVEGVDNDPIGDGVAVALDFSEYLEFDISDTLTPGPDATGILLKGGTGSYAGVRYPRTGVDSAYRTVFLGFPFDALPEDDVPPNARADLLRRILVFLAPGLNGEGAVALDSSAYTIPSQLTVEVADSDLEGQGQVNISLFSTTEPAGRPLTLTETARRGVFRGRIALVATNSGSGEPELRVRSGDTVRADYFDASLNALVSAVATVETTPPAVSGVGVEPGYVDAIVYWETSEPADATVQFGESPRLGRSAVDPEFVDYHEVTLYQLEADRTYYYRIISRDRAGNVTVDDNNGQLYTFRTLRPIQPPWADDGEQGDTNWVVYTVEDSERGWELGEPYPLLLSAHSPTHAWSCNLSLDSVSQVESFLISPALQLTGGNRFTLRFWQNYDFTLPFEYDIFHAGELLLVTNNALTTISLAEYFDEATDWHEVEFDLSPYAGQIVYLVWHYFLFSLEYWPRQGWLIDDLSLSVSTVAPGTIQITNNLSQAAFTLSGPVSRTGTGQWLLITNAPPGQYVVTYNPVPYFQTPPAQTNQLQSGATLLFTGQYSILDANQNSLPDAWEQQYFGAVTNHAPFADSDQDGASDYAEFVSGTNPTNRLSVLALSTPAPPANGVLRFDWLGAAGRSYRLLGSPDLRAWTPVTDWLRTPSGYVSQTVAVPTGTVYQFYRLEVRP